jgi:hypothetical protein
MSARLLRRVLQDRESSTQDPNLAADEEPEHEEEVSPPRAAPRNPFDLLGDDADEGEGDKVRASSDNLVRIL